VKSKPTPSFPGLNASRRPSKLGDILAQKKIIEARQLTPEQRLLVALELSAAAFYRAGARKRSDRKILT
jgi:hypothetical protein